MTDDKYSAPRPAELQAMLRNIIGTFVDRWNQVESGSCVESELESRIVALCRAHRDLGSAETMAEFDYSRSCNASEEEP